MNDVIRLLPDSVANQIAAGEVIQRPASVVKELVENAVDAGATDIRIIITDAGRTLIQVVDDGCGMSDTDARMAFERHATSKIEQAADLFSLHTMGFRGEALASIAAVAQVDLRTMRHGADIGTRILISGSHVDEQTPEACAPGCNMMVKNLFFNVPARRKFLKRDSVELSNILHEFERLALVNPGIDFTLTSNGGVVHKLMKASLKQRISDLFGKGLDKQLLPVQTATSIVKISGFIGRPEFARRRNQLQYFFVNGRHMRHPYFHKALLLCYERLLAADMQPNYFINFEVEPATIDVNIHPTKNEIKFENENAIWQILTAAVKEALGRFGEVPGIDFDREDAPDIPVFNPDATAAHGIELDADYNPFTLRDTDDRTSRGSGSAGSFHRADRPFSDWEKLYEGFTSGREDAEPDRRSINVPAQQGSALNQWDSTEAAPTLDLDTAPAERQDVGTIQVKNRYILSPSKSGVMVIDQHRAHMKVLYERYMSMLASGTTGGQKVMFPDMLRLSPSQAAMFRGIIGELEKIGYEFSFLGDDTWSVNSVPSAVQNGNSGTVERLLRIVDNVADGADAGEDMRRNVALSMAQAEAINAGRALDSAEREHLLGELFRLPSPNYTPDGKLIVSIIPIEELSGLF
ncbi:MAG: DNA mismatch repair endonuclease MutL [Muribaculaceae bacterium]|nr:DNA mismatch repair endonuclease MutL [Muribaculaceae bacterium]